MKLQIKTLNQKSIVVDIEETKTVYDLKRELSLYADVGVEPELQNVIYAGKILVNEEKLCTYNIDVKKCLVIMILKQPLVEPQKDAQQPQRETVAEEPAKETPSTTSTSVAEPEFKTPIPIDDRQKQKLVDQLVQMGYAELEVRKALAASFYNPELAIEYLVDGIPASSPATPEGDVESWSDTETELTPFEVFRVDPTFQSLRNALQQNPELLDAAIQRIGETNPSMLNLINENQREFLSMLVQGSDDEDCDDDGLEYDDD